MSNRGMQSMDRRHEGFFIVVSGPSGVGKSTLVDVVMGRVPKLRYSVSSTTRPPRPGEVDGSDYFFLDRDEFERKAAAGDFLEWAEFCGNLYGTPRDYIQRSIDEGLIVIMDIDMQGATMLRPRMPSGVFVFLLPPSLEELQARLKGRGSEGEEAIHQRLEVALTELEAIHQYDYVIVNDDRDRAAYELEAIIRAEQCRMTRSLYPKALARLIQGDDGNHDESAASR